jgi:Ribosomal protein L6P/L9E
MEKFCVKAQGTRDKTRAVMNTARSIITNLCEGVVEGYTIKMKVVFSHFPITVESKKENKF